MSAPDDTEHVAQSDQQMAAEYLNWLWQGEAVSSWHLYSCPAIHLPHFKRVHTPQKAKLFDILTKFLPQPFSDLQMRKQGLSPLRPCVDALCGPHTFILSPGFESSMCRLLAVTVATQCWCLPGLDIWMQETGEDLRWCSKQTILIITNHHVWIQWSWWNVTISNKEGLLHC